MRVRKGILCVSFIFILFLIFFLAYPLYVHWIAGNYAKQFSIILDSHDMEKYDSFFDEDTLFAWNGKEVCYSDARNNMNQMKSFTSVGAYGHLDEDTNVYTDGEYIVSLMLPISDFDDGNVIREPGLLEGEFILQREWLFFFRIKQVNFYGDKEGFLDRFLKGNVIKVSGFNMKYEPKDRRLNISDFEKIELGFSYEDIEGILGEADGWIGGGILRPVYILEDGTAVVCYFSDPEREKGLKEIERVIVLQP